MLVLGRRFPVKPLKFYLVLLLFLGVWIRAFASSSGEAIVMLISRVPFVSWTMETLQQDLKKNVGLPINLIFRFLKNDRGEVEADFLLLENDVFPKCLQKSEWKILRSYRFVWGLAFIRSSLAEVASSPPRDLPQFQGCLDKLRARFPETYPWFDSLNSGCTLFHLSGALRSEQKDTGNQSGGVLNTFLNRGFLNPLSLEADESLAFEVLGAKDAVFSSLWVPLDLFRAEESYVKISPDLGFMPFPGGSPKPSLPWIEFKLWGRKSYVCPDSISEIGPASFPNFLFLKSEMNKEKAWRKNSYRDFYDSILSGKQ